MKILLVIASILLITEFAEAGFGWNGGSQNGGQGQGNWDVQRPSYYNNQNDKYYETKSQFDEDFSTVRKPLLTAPRSVGISAWGIIAIIVGAIVSVVVGCYAFALYPYVCKKQKNREITKTTSVV